MFIVNVAKQTIHGSCRTYTSRRLRHTEKSMPTFFPNSAHWGSWRNDIIPRKLGDQREIPGTPTSGIPHSHTTPIRILVGGFNPSEKYWSKWESCPVENKRYLKPPARIPWVVWEWERDPTYGTQWIGFPWRNPFRSLASRSLNNISSMGRLGPPQRWYLFSRPKAWVVSFFVAALGCPSRSDRINGDRISGLFHPNKKTVYKEVIIRLLTFLGHPSKER